MAIGKKRSNKTIDEESPSPTKNPTHSTTPQPFHIVGIGASAGGLEAIEQFFKKMPPDNGIAFVIVQHLDPARHSSMPEIMSRLTKMPVHVATDGLKVVPDSVYLIPPDKNMGIKDGALYLQEVTESRGLRLPVDFFLRSLAKERGTNSIAIILSGTGTDGTLGLRAIKAEAGTVFVQDPESARYDGMPRSAVNTGLADFVLPPQEMPGKLIEFVKHVAVNGTRISTVTEKSGEPLQQVFAILSTRTGHDFSHYKPNTVRRRLERRMSVNGIDSIADYARFLRENETESKALLKDLLISVTSFFRDPEAFDALKEQLCASMKDRAQRGDIRVWVAGCATGEEAYSIAMAISECMDEQGKRFQIQMYGTDIDTDALNIARAGVYPANIAADLTLARLKRFFLKQENSYQVKKELREMVVFAPQDFIKDPPFSRMDLICCRNLLIYLESDVQKRLLPLLHYALKPGGMLFLGPSETTGEASDLFSTLDKKWKLFQRKETFVSPERLKFPSSFAPTVRELTAEPLADQTVRIPALSEKIFLDSYAPTFAVIDEKYHLVYVRGRTGKYLEIASGQPNLSIMELAREGLRSDLTSAVYEAAKDKKAVYREGVRVKYNGGYQAINLTVAPLTERGMPSGLLMVVFQEVGQATVEGKTGLAKERRRGSALIEEELRLTKGNLQKSIEELEAGNEELKSANEELQSNNEELQSTNEELDTSREELQSLNEEMMTVNAELTSKTEMLTNANDDLKNYLNRTDIAIIFLDENLNIRSYTPATSDVFNIRDIDIGRPLDEITSRLAYQGVIDNAREVIRTLTPKEIEVQRRDGHWYTMRILPYLTVQNILAGLVLSFLDIDKQRRAVDELAGLNKELKVALEKRQKLERDLLIKDYAIQSATTGIGIADLEGNLTYANRAMLQMGGFEGKEAFGKPVSIFFKDGEKDAGKVIKAVSEKGSWHGELKVKKKDGSIYDVMVWANLVNDDKGKPVCLMASVVDITERIKAEEKIAYQAKLLDTIEDCILNTDNEGRIIYWGNGAVKLLGWQPEDVIGRSAADVLGHGETPEKAKAIGDLLRKGQTWSGEFNVKRVDGTPIPLLIHSSPVLDDAGNMIGIIGVGKDITELKKLDHLKDEFIGMVSHEMRTPLTVITGAVQTAMDERLSNDDRRGLLKDASAASETLADILENLLELSRYQANRLKLDKRQTDIAESASPIVEEFRRQVPTHSILLEIPAGLPQLVIDPVRFQRVLHNLLENAIKYSPEGSEVRVFARQEGGNLVIGVSDQGPGISVEDRQKLFEPFQRLENRSKANGIGLGLVVCKRLVEAHNGRIWVESAPGEGATFLFALPSNEKD